MMEKTLCIRCGEPIHLATDAEKAGLTYKDKNNWKHDSGFWYCQDEAGNAAEPAPKEGKTLADFAGSDKLFKRPMHANPHGFTAGSDHLKEIRTSTWGGQVNVCADFPRLTREDLTATDWEEVTLPKEVEEYRKFGPNNTTNTGADGLLPALN
jgi:hypothetical protein